MGLQGRIGKTSQARCDTIALPGSRGDKCNLRVDGDVGQSNGLGTHISVQIFAITVLNLEGLTRDLLEATINGICRAEIARRLSCLLAVSRSIHSKPFLTTHVSLDPVSTITSKSWVPKVMGVAYSSPSNREINSPLPELVFLLFFLPVKPLR
jgi:hypothetical protein